MTPRHDNPSVTEGDMHDRTRLRGLVIDGLLIGLVVIFWFIALAYWVAT